jgi:hypothetical protein
MHTRGKDLGQQGWDGVSMVSREMKDERTMISLL